MVRVRLSDRIPVRVSARDKVGAMIIIRASVRVWVMATGRVRIRVRVRVIVRVRISVKLTEILLVLALALGFGQWSGLDY